MLCSRGDWGAEPHDHLQFSPVTCTFSLYINILEYLVCFDFKFELIIWFLKKILLLKNKFENH